MIDKLISAANQRLKAQGIKLRINSRGETLFLRGYLPPKSGTGEFTRQDLRMGTTATPSGLMQIEAQAIAITDAIKSGTFSWHNYQKNLPQIDQTKQVAKPQPKVVSDWIRDFEQYYFSRRARTSASLLTWKKDYLSTFRKLNPDGPLTALAIEQVVLSTPADSRVRQRCCICFNALAKFAQIQIDLSQWVGNYSPKRLKPRNIPDDKIITKYFYTISVPAWKWCVGMLATYGLRNHELFRVNHLSIELGNPIITVDEGKTGFRIVYPIYPEWYEQFQLQTVLLPPVNFHNSNDSLGHTVSQAFRRLELPFKPYDLRHAWAIRSLLFGLDVSFAAQMMGHSLRVHHDTYHHWITEGHYERAFQLLMERADRPRPPGP